MYSDVPRAWSTQDDETSNEDSGFAGFLSLKNMSCSGVLASDSDEFNIITKQHRAQICGDTGPNKD